MAFPQAVTLQLLSGKATPGTTVNLNLNLTSSQSDPAAAVQWTLHYPTADFSAVTLRAGPAATAANKSLTCKSGLGTATCSIWGLNDTPIPNGVVAVASVSVAAAPANSNAVLELTAGSAAARNAASLSTASTGATVSIGPGLNGFSCAAASLNPQSSSTCKVALTSPALSGGAKITLSASPADVTMPSSITLPQGATSGTFTVTAGIVKSSTSVTLKASYSSVNETFGLTINPVKSKTITYVQGNYATPQSPQSTVSVTFKSAQDAGDINVIAVGWNDSVASVTGVTDSAGNVYTLATGPTVVSGFGSQSIYYAKNIKSSGAGADVVTVKFSRPARFADIRVAEYSGVDRNNPLGGAVIGSGNGKTSSTATAKTTNPRDLLFGANLVQTSTTGPGSGFTQRIITSPDGDLVEDWIVDAAGSYTATAPLSSSGYWIIQMVAFRAAQ